jgi:PEP-CTERM motif
MRFMYSAVLAAISLAGSVSAAPILIVNHSFEDDLQARVRAFNTLTPSGWTSIGAGTRGTFQPSAVEFNTGAPGLGTVPADNIPDGIQTFYSNGGDIGQVLGTAIGPAGTQYTLSVYVGDRWDRALTSYTIRLLAGGVPLVSATNPVTPAEGQFAQATLNYTADGTEAGLLAIQLIANAATAQVNFDNVALDVHLVPEPASIALLGAGLLGLGLYRRRRVTQ